MTIEHIVLEAVTKELNCAGSASVWRSVADRRMLSDVLDQLSKSVAAIDGHLRDVNQSASLELDPLDFAAQFLAASPLPISIKTASDHRFLWCNSACAGLLGRRPDELLGKTLMDVLGLRADHLSVSHMSELSRDNPRFVYEEYPIGQEHIPVSVYRFPFSAGGVKLIGDLSIEISNLSSANNGPVILKNIFDMNLQPERAVAAEFLRHLKTVVVLKDLDAKVLWCNETFVALAGSRDESELLLRTSGDIFSLPPGHPTPEYDRRVATEGIAILGPQSINGITRFVAHFPITEFGEIRYLGVVSCEAKDVQGYREKSSRVARRGSRTADSTVLGHST